MDKNNVDKLSGRPVIFEDVDYGKARKNLTLENLKNFASPEQLHIMDHGLSPRNGGPIFVSRDWDLEGKINCASKDCIANNGRGKCGMPSLIKMNSKGQCEGYEKINSKRN